MTSAAGRLLSVVFECADPDEEARFWEEVLGYVRHHDQSDWVTIRDPSNPARRLSFQQVEDHVAPIWPTRDRPQQAHLDLLVENLDAAEASVMARGARRLSEDTVVHEEESIWVDADPAGHPFCLIVQTLPDL